MSWIAVGVGVVAVVAGAGSAAAKAGKKPKIPGVPGTDVSSLQLDAIAGNQAAVDPASKFASSVNRANQTELDRIREGTLPGGKAAAQKFITDQLMGVADVADTQAGIRNATAAGFQLGTGGSQFSKFGIVGHLGRSVAQQRQQGLQNFANFASFSEAPRYNPASMFLSPEMRVNVAQQDAKMRLDQANAQAAIDAQPSAWMQALGGGLGALSNIAGMYAGGAAGAAGAGAARAPAASSGGGFVNNPSWYSSQGWNQYQAPPSQFGTTVQQWS